MERSPRPRRFRWRPKRLGATRAEGSSPPARPASPPPAARSPAAAPTAPASSTPGAPPAAAPGGPAAPPASAPLFRISLAEWSFHRALRGGGMDPLDFPLVAKRDYGIEAVEYVNTFNMMDYPKDVAPRGPEWLRQLKARGDDHGVRHVLIMCDALGDLGDPDESKRRAAVDRHKPWAEAAKFLGCHSIRVNAQSAGTWDEQRDRAAAGLRALCEFADGLGLNVIVENHGGLSSNGKWLAETIRAVGHPRAGTLPDFGNFNLGDGKEYDRYLGVSELMPFAKGVSAKSHDFVEEGEGRGNERFTDYRRMLRIVVDAGYHGFLGVEYEGDRLSEPDGIKATKALLERVRAEMAAA
ncbi:MAG: sugar phosphate isomerase/epimerase family protein [Phycisphaerales bacterium]